MALLRSFRDRRRVSWWLVPPRGQTRGWGSPRIAGESKRGPPNCQLGPLPWWAPRVRPLAKSPTIPSTCHPPLAWSGNALIVPLLPLVPLLLALSPAVPAQVQENLGTPRLDSHAPAAIPWADPLTGVAAIPPLRLPHGKEEAARRLAAGAPRDAADLCAPPIEAEGPDELPCRLLVAQSLLQLERFDEAAAALAPAKGRLGPLEPWGALLLAEARLRGGAEESGRELLAAARAADPQGPLGRRSQLLEAFALAQEAKPKEAVSLLRRLASQKGGDPARIQLAIAELSLAAGDPAGAARTWRRIWVERAGLPEADEAHRQLALLADAKLSPPPPTPAEQLARVEQLLSRGKAREAEEALASLAPGPGLDAGALLLLRARALSDQERKEEAEALLAPALQDDAPFDAAALTLGARLAMRRDAVELAVARLDRVAKEAGGVTEAEAAFLAAFFVYDAGRFEEAEGRFRSFLMKYAPRRLEETRWYIAWSLYKQGKDRTAAAELAKLIHQSPKSSLLPQATYWRARALQRAGDEAEAKALLTHVAKRWPSDWYGILAAQRLELVPAHPQPKLLAPSPLRQPGTPLAPGTVGARLVRAEALYSVGLLRAAGDELDAALAGRQPRALLEESARIALRHGDPFRAFQLGLFRLGGLDGAADLAYPRAFEREVLGSADRHGIEPELVWAIMRQESGFRPRIRSAADAVGLMQILPVTAERLGALLGLPGGQGERLEDPAVNIALGSYYLAALQTRFGGNHVLTAAAYNAGPPNVVRWLEDPTRSSLPLDEFVDSMPFRETRGYVKAVLTNLYAYRLVHGGPLPTLQLELPKVAPGIDF